MKNPIAIFSSIAAIAATALGTTLYVNQAPETPMAVTAPVEAGKTPDAAATTEAPAAPAAETPAQQQAAVEPAPSSEQPAAADSQPAEVALVPVAEPPVAEAPAVETPAAETPAADAPAAQTPAAGAPAGTAAADAPAAVAPAVSETAPAQQQAAVVAAPSLPSFDTVRVEPTGDAIIAGRAEPESDVTVKWNGNIVGTTKANADGSFVLIPAKALKTGIGAMTIEMAMSGKITTSEGSVFVVVKKDAPATIAKVDPVAPTQVVQAGTPVETPRDLQLTAVDYDATGNIVFSGKATPGTVVRFYVDNVATGEGLADAGGAWSFSGTSSVAPGTHNLRADAVDAAGAVLSRIELPFLREDAATVAAAQVAVAAPVEQAPVTRSAVAAQPEASTAAQPSETEAAQPAVDAALQPSAETQVAIVPEQPAAPAVEEGPRKLVIQPGNNLWKLSREVYGKGRMYTIIYEANRELVKNPNRIYPGQILTAPKQP